MPPPDTQLLRLAVQNLACAPQAQRRYVQMGLMRRAVANLDRLGADPGTLEGGKPIAPEGAGLIRALREDVLAQVQAHPDFLEETGAEPREYLFGHALENEDWERIRRQARRCHSHLAGDGSPFLAIMAK